MKRLLLLVLCCLLAVRPCIPMLPFRFGTTEEALELALDLFKKGQQDVAVTIAKEVLKTSPKNHKCLSLLGQMLSVNPSQREIAQEYLRQALVLDPSNPFSQYWLGTILWTEGDLVGAQERFRLVIANVRSNEELLYNSHMGLGKIFAYHMNMDDDPEHLWHALREFQAAEKVAFPFPDPLGKTHKAEIYFHRGLVFDQLGLVDQSIMAYTNAVQYDPSMAFAHANKATLLLRQGLNEDAFMSALSALNIEPGNGDLHNNVAVVLFEKGNTDMAEYHWREAVRLNPNCLHAHASLGNMYQDKSEAELAQKHWKIASALAGSSGQNELAYAINVRSKLGLERVFRSFQHVSETRTRYEEALAQLLEQQRPSFALSSHRSIDILAELVTDIGYYYAYLGFSNVVPREQQAQLYKALVPELASNHHHHHQKSSSENSSINNNDVCSGKWFEHRIECKCRDFTQNHEKTWVVEKKNLLAKRRRIGFISEYFADHSVSKLIRNTIKLLSLEKEENWEIVLFVIGQARNDQHSNKLMDHVQRVVHINANYPSLLENVLYTRKMIRKEALDILVFPEIGMGHLTYFVAYERVAPVQIAFWGHPVTTGLRETIDYFISSKLFERNWSPQRDGRKYSEALWLMDGLSTLFPQPPPPLFLEKEEARKQLLGEAYLNATVYVIPQTSYKFHPLMDRALTDILKIDRKGILVLIDSKRSEWIQKVKKRIGVNQQDLLDRIVIVKPMPLDHFLSLVGVAADVVLDTFPFGGGVSHFEALSVHAPVVVYAHKIPWIPQYARGIYEYIFQAHHGNPINLVTPTIAEYVRTAITIANNSTIQAETRKSIQQAVDKTGLFFTESRTDNIQQLLTDWKTILACVQGKDYFFKKQVN